MKNLLLIITLIGCSATSFSQFHYSLDSKPNSATVYVNGVEECVTPCVVKYRWKENIDGKIVISMKADGFKTWADTIREKPLYLDKSELAYMKKSFKVFDLKDNENLVSFDKLIAEFKDDQVVGKVTDKKGVVEELKWSGSIKVGDEVYEKKFYTYLTDMGYKSPYTEEVKLFSGETRSRPKLPRFAVGVEIVDYNLTFDQVKSKTSRKYEVLGKNDIQYKWSVLDKSNGKIALTYTNRGVINYKTSMYDDADQNLDSYVLALIDFFSSDEFHGLITETEKAESTELITDSKIEGKPNVIKKITLPKFEKSSDMIREANKACVTIITDGGHGSGVIISKEGYMLTAYHVVEGVNSINVKFSSGLTLKAEVVEFDKFNDLALLDIQGDGFPALPLLPNKAEVALGEEVITIGTPAELELGQSLSKGIVSGKRKIENRVYIQSDISVSPGNSGGPLINMSGEVIGIVQKKIIGEGIEGIGFSIPMDTIREILKIEDK